MSKRCQSCGMPLKKDPEGGGTHTDGSKSADYCSLCYQGGAFTQPNFTAQDMQAFCIQIMREKMHLPRPIGWLFTRDIPKLQRWQSSP